MNEILHLHWRAGFGLTPSEWEIRKQWKRSKAIKYLFAEAKKNSPLPSSSSSTVLPDRNRMSKEMIAERRKQERRLVQLQNVAWVQRMADSDTSALLERMTLFWHGHFACKSRNSKLARQQLSAIRTHALGNFRDLVLAVAKDVSMIRFLNNQQNKKSQPNENFARELLELFTIGRGHYTEQDVKEAARAFTGWSSNLRGEYIFRQRQHDFGRKRFMGKSGNFDGDDIINIVLDRKETAQFICSKIYRYFVNEKENPKIIADLADYFYQSDYEIEPLMRRIFESDWFYARENVGTKIKSPVEYAVGLIRNLQVDFHNELAAFFVQRALGQVLFDPPNVAGWPGGKSWIDNSTLMLRLNIPSFLLYSQNVNFRVKDDLKAQKRGKAFGRLGATINLEPFHKQYGKKSEAAIFEAMAEQLLQVPAPIGPAFVQRLANARRDSDYIKLCLLALMSLPEYQMC